VNITDIFDEVVSHASRLGVFSSVNTSDPTNTPSAELSAYISIASCRTIQASGLNTTSARLELTVQIFTSTIQSPVDTMDMELLNAVDLLIASFCNDFTLDGELRMVDILGSEGDPLGVSFGYVDQDDNTYRVAVITLPLLINDVWTQEG
jgi:hypothetical protein